MRQSVKITKWQLFCLLFLSRILVGLTYSPQMANSTGIWDLLVSEFFSFILTFIFAIPIYFLYRENPDLSLVDRCLLYFKKIGYIIIFIYAVYFLFLSIKTLFDFNILITNVINPEMNEKLLLLAIIVVCSYAAIKGIEGLARTAFLVLAIIILVSIFILCTLLSQIDPANYTPLISNKKNDIINGLIYIVANNTSLLALAFLLIFVKGSIKKGLIFWNIAVYIFITIFIIVVNGALGDYAKTQFFPIYSAASVAEIGVLRRLDSIYLGIFILGIFIKVALFLFLFSLACDKLFGEKYHKLSIIIGGVLTFLSNLIISNFELKFIYSVEPFFILTLLTAFVIPAVLWGLTLIKKRRNSNEK